MWPYLRGVLIGIDILIAALLGARAYQTISARAYENYLWRHKRETPVLFINWLLRDDDHCGKAYRRWWSGARYATHRHG